MNRSLAAKVCLIVLAAAALGSARMQRAKPRAEIEGFDSLAPPGRSVTLRAKVVARGFLGIRVHPRGEEVIFSRGEAAIGRALTGNEGIATLEWKPPESPEECAITVMLASGARHEATPSTLRVFVRDPKRRTLVVDIDGTICDASGFAVLTKPSLELCARDGSAAALRSLASAFDIVYLTGRDDALLARTREWLDLREFPHGPILVRNLGLFTLSAKRYKARALDELRRDFTLAAGVGDREEDAKAYLAAGMIAILVGDEDDVPKGASKVASWPEVAKLLLP
ncbi:MAG: hypothetical protein HY292_02135 [Planctomycetes bacterium]|nr:hypothetical protein [Planctomycetota bacterium]